MAEACVAGGRVDDGGATDPQDEAVFDPVATRIFHGACGRIVLTVQAASPADTRLLARVCGAALEGAVARVYGVRLEKH